MKAVCQQYYRARNNHRSPLLVSSLGLGHFWPRRNFPPGVVSRKRGVTGCGDRASKEISRPSPNCGAPFLSPRGSPRACLLVNTRQTRWPPQKKNLRAAPISSFYLPVSSTNHQSVRFNSSSLFFASTSEAKTSFASRWRRGLPAALRTVPPT